MNVVEVKFDNNMSDGRYLNELTNLRKNVTVIVESDRGLQFGKVVNIITDVEQFEGVSLNKVVRISSKKDYLRHLNNLKDGKRALVVCKNVVKDSGLPMSVLDASYNFDRSQLLFRFVANERVDFRKLARDLGSIFKTRIELRQIGVRDKAKEVSGIGPCGRMLCCSSFLENFGSITISMAKNQKVSLNPNKINGVCGRLFCCLKYEDDIYTNYRKEMLNVGDSIVFNGKRGNIISVDILKKKYKVEFADKCVMVVDADDKKK